MAKTRSGMPEEPKPQTTTGYDSALGEKLDDDLGRSRFGKTGEGKSTVLHFLDSMLRSDENIIFTFNPWAVQNLEEMWAEFGTQLIEALKEANIFVASRQLVRARTKSEPFLLIPRVTRDVKRLNLRLS